MFIIKTKHFNEEVNLIKDEFNNLNNLEKIVHFLKSKKINCHICYTKIDGETEVSPAIKLNYEELQALLIFSLIKDKESDICGN